MKTLTLDTSQLIDWLKCPDYHNYKDTQNLIRLSADRSSLDKGTIFHGLLERYYRKIFEGCSASDAFSFALSQLNEIHVESKLDPDDYKLLTLRFIDYWTKYGNDKVEIYSVDGEPALEIGFSIKLLENDDYLFILEGRIDLITKMSNQLVVWDHKTQGREYWIYESSIQVLNYCLAAKINNFMYNYIRLHQNLQPNTFMRKLIYISPTRIERWKEKLIRYFNLIVNNPSQLDAWPHPGCADIGWGKICPYTQLCEQSNERVREILIQRDYQQKKPWEPWSLEPNGTGGAE